MSVAKVAHDVQKSLRNYQLSLDLENKVLYSHIEALNKEKRLISNQYSAKSE